MDDVTANLIVIAATGIVVAAIFFYSHQTRNNKQKAIQELAGQHGWQFTVISERLAWGTRLAAKNWELIAKSESIGQAADSGSSNISSETRFLAKWNTPPEFSFLIGPRLSTGLAGLFIPPEYANLRELDPKPQGLPDDYVCLADSFEITGLLENSTILHQLELWPGKTRPLIQVKPAGLVITINGYRMEKPAELEKLVMLGETIFSAVNR
jgi:hypothetical protein